MNTLHTDNHSKYVTQIMPRFFVNTETKKVFLCRGWDGFTAAVVAHI